MVLLKPCTLDIFALEVHENIGFLHFHFEQDKFVNMVLCGFDDENPKLFIPHHVQLRCHQSRVIKSWMLDPTLIKI
jgi:hypothetical protein